MYAPTNYAPKTIVSPLRGLELVSTFTAAKVLFPNETIRKSHLRLVQRLCRLHELEAYKIGRRYYIVKRAIYEYIEDHYYGTPKATAR